MVKLGAQIAKNEKELAEVSEELQKLENEIKEKISVHQLIAHAAEVHQAIQVPRSVARSVDCRRRELVVPDQRINRLCYRFADMKA